MLFFVGERGYIGPNEFESRVVLEIDRWDDYSFVTQFFVTYYDGSRKKCYLGRVKIGYFGQTESSPTYERLKNPFNLLPDNFFSLGVDNDFYRNASSLPESLRYEILNALRDIVANPEIVAAIVDEPVFYTSLLRDASVSIIRGQYTRLLAGENALTNFEFKFVRQAHDGFGEISLDFSVEVDRLPSTNIHAIIGRNGAGKTSLLNAMIESVASEGNRNNSPIGWFDHIQRDNFDSFGAPLAIDFFSALVSVSFSAFDPFRAPPDQPNPKIGPRYFYIGLRDEEGQQQRTLEELQRACIFALAHVFEDMKRTKRWLKAISRLSSSDANFRMTGLEDLLDIYNDTIGKVPSLARRRRMLEEGEYGQRIKPIFDSMSSGHAIVLISITHLVATVDEKTLVLIDEPESHLHPPLLAAFLRALADLLHDQNGVAIIATHSPVVLQEIPRRCVWKMSRFGQTVSLQRPNIETYGENVGVLTTEVFGLEAGYSGFHEQLASLAKAGGTYDEIIDKFDNQLGMEGRAILASLIGNRDAGNEL